MTENTSAATTRAPVACHPLKPFDTKDWPSIAKAFEGATEFTFSQHWMQVKDEAFRPARVRMGWRDDRLLYFAEFTDDNINTVARERNEEFYRTGDVFEIFAGFTGDPAYIEYHLSPNNVILQLRFPDSEALKNAGHTGLHPFFIRDDDAVLQARVEEGRWLIYGELPADSLPGATKPIEGTIWQVSFCRYDYAAGGTSPVLSSTSLHEQASYHRRHEWRPIQFRRGLENH